MTLTRREFFGLSVFVLLPSESDGQRARPALPKDIGAWLHISQDGKIVVYTGKAEVGQNTRTSLTQAVADELSVPLESVQLVMADTSRVPFDMGTFGSQSTPVMSPQLRRAAAAARETLIGLAAEQWKIDRAELNVKAGGVTARDGRTAKFTELTRGRKLVETITADGGMKPPGAWTVAGKSAKKAGGRDFVTGRHQYASDIRRPGMLYGRVLRAPAFGARLDRLEPDAALIRDGDFAGVAAPDPVAASAALSRLKPGWSAPPPQVSDTELFTSLQQTAGAPRVVHEAGDAAQQFANVGRRLTASYTVHYIAHAPLEPRAAVAEWADGRLTVWTGTQRPFGVRDELMRIFGLSDDQVRVIVPDTGSAYGGKHSGEYAIEAARLAKAAGKPVKLVWTREEEFTWAYFRPAGVIEIEAALGPDGLLNAWTYRNYNSGTSAIRTPYDIGHQRIEFFESKAPLKQGSYRALAATANTFARESAMDELAGIAVMDPLDFRLRNMKDPRLRAVLSAAAERFRWTGSKGRADGLACGTEKGSYVASCSEIALEAGKLKVKRVVTAFECGAIVNPDHLKSQVEGAVVMALGGALFERIRFDGGRILNSRFASYRVPRFSDVPEIEVVLLDRKDLKSAGAGETPLIAVAPSIANAIAGATGERRRSLPLTSG